MPTYAVIINDVVANTINWDGVEDFGQSADDILIAIPENVSVSTGYTYSDGTFTAPPEPSLTHAQQSSLALEKKQQLMKGINDYTSLWQTQLTLGVLTDADKLTLIAWMKYAQALQAINPNDAPDITWPDSPAE